MQHADVPVRVQTIVAGKLRRYSDIPLHKQLLHIPTVARNVTDMFKVIGGILQSLWLLLRERPDVVFAKGGYVSLPMGWAAHILRIPLVIHDSDARPGLTNRILARWATMITTGAPLENYTYESERARYVGVPIDDTFHPFSADEQRAAKKMLGFDETTPLVVVTGGGLGARDINQAVVAIAQQLLEKGYGVYHVAGEKQFNTIQRAIPSDTRYMLVPFVYKDMAQVLGAADVVISRASATFLQELSALAKPIIIIPSSSLSDQIKNAEQYEKAGAAVVLRDEQIGENPTALLESIVKITTDNEYADSLSTHLHGLAKPQAAHDMAIVLLEAGK